MNTENELKEVVRNKYREIALSDNANHASSCCGSTPASQEVYNIMTDDYDNIEGYAKDADLGLGCGLPTQFAHIKRGDTVIDLGSGAGNDCFVARHECGPEGRVIGIDFTVEMIQRAWENADRLGYQNVEFRYGDIEDMPVANAMADVVVSNCVLNLVPNKKAVMEQVFRVLKPGGHFSISDVVLVGELPEALRKDAELYAGCVSGAVQKAEYLRVIEECGFERVAIQKEKPIHLPDDILSNYLDAKALREFREGKTGIFSVTVYGEKPSSADGKPDHNVQTSMHTYCAPGSGCC